MMGSSQSCYITPDSASSSTTTLDDYDYHLPSELIAQEPAQTRTNARLLRLTAEKKQDTYIRELPHFLKKGDVLVFNNTKVLKARLLGVKESGGKAEVLINRILNLNEAEVLVRASRPAPIGSHIYIQDDPKVALQITGRKDNLYLIKTTTHLIALCRRYGNLPLPPYITREAQAQDTERYQTVLAKKEGAVAAPTAGIHFTQGLLEQLRENGVKIVEVTLHIGAATFTPIRETDFRKHRMHTEWCHLSATTAHTLNRARARNQRIIAVGTTSLRVLETAYRCKGQGAFQDYDGDTSLFIYPGGEPVKSVDLLLTNFHLPRSSLLLLVCAFGGYKEIMDVYTHAIKQKYRFFSYGDAMLVTRKNGT